MWRSPLGDEGGGIAASEPDTASPQPTRHEGYEMFHHELQQIRSAELIREAAEHRLAREARRAAREESRQHDAERRPDSPRPRPRRHRFARVA